MDAQQFISRFGALYRQSPQISHWTRQSENCDYGDIIVVSRNSYMCFWSANLENCFYCHESRKDRFCGDCFFCEDCELCYECVDCTRCYNCDFCQDCKQCTDCSLCYYCIGCTNCFGCADLKRREYHIFNEPYSKEEYFQKLEEIKRWPREKIEAKFEEVKRKTPRVFMHQLDNENCFGDYVHHSKNCYYCFDGYLCEDSMYIFNANLERGTKDSLDCGPIANTLEHCYDCAYMGYLFNCKHIYWADYLHDCSWSSHIWNCNHCYGCVYIKNKEYRLLNEPVSKEEYEKTTKRLDRELYESGVRDFFGLVHWGEKDVVVRDR